MDKDLDVRLRAIEDRAELWELVCHYGIAVDDGAYEELGGLFAEDATFAGLQGKPAEGREAVVAYLKHRADTANQDSVHTPTSQVLHTISGDQAHGTVICYAALFGYDQSRAFFAFRYDDHYVRTSDRWTFSSRRVHALTHIIND
jgi:ketosteroid isomerase-like protein